MLNTKIPLGPEEQSAEQGNNQEQKSRHKTPPLPVRIRPGYPAVHLSQEVV